MEDKEGRQVTQDRGSVRPVFAAACALVVLTAAVAATAGAASGPAAPAAEAAGSESLSGRHLFLVPATGDAAIEAANAKVIARYESFTLVSAEGAASEPLLAAGADLRDDMRKVTVADGAVNPAGLPAPNGGGGPSLALVQFVGPVKDAWLDTVRETGATIVTYMAENAYVVYAAAGEARAVADLATAHSVRAVVPFTAANKTAPGTAPSGTVKVAVGTVAGAPGAAARDLLATGERLNGASAVGGTVTEFVAIDAARVAELSHDPGVVSVEPWVEPELFDERAASIVAGRINAAGSAPTAPGYLAYLNAKGFPGGLQGDMIDITDEGVDKGVVPVPAGAHPDFFLNGNPANASRLSYAQEATSDPDARDCGGHGTNVASIAAGFNNGTGAAVEDAQGYNYGLGIAPRVEIGATKIFNCAGNFQVFTSYTALRTFGFAQGARVSNNSWGAPVGGAYNADSQTFDALVRDAQPATPGNQQMTNVFSAGNAGSGANTIGAPGTAKNVITVGASESIRPAGTDGCGVTDAGADNAKDIIDFSSRGPTDDGRIKPDIVAPGTHVTGAQPQVGADYNGSGTCNPQFPAGSPRYSLVSGTSQAAPEVTGFAALIRNWFRRTQGGGTTNPTPAMIKAIMVNTAVDQVGGNDGAAGTNANIPTQIQGWGRVSLKNLLDGTDREFRDQAANPIEATGETETTVYSVDDPTKPVKVTLVWTDTPGPTSGDAFVNNLDLAVHFASSGNSYKGNVFSGGVSMLGGSADPRNNVENVFLPAGITGPFAVNVRGTNIAGNGVPGNPDTTDQDYALVVSNANAANAPVLGHENAVTTDDSDGDGFLEPGETFRLRERLRNLGTATASGINGVLTGPDRTTVLDDTSAYPNIPAGATAINTALFRVRLAGNYVCGKTAQMRLDLTTNQGPRRVRFGIPTGGPPTSSNPNSTDVPKAIPDNTAAGVDSVLNIVGAGSITDLNVRIGSITHTFDGDLAISLIGPDATTVSLVNRRGGSGDNFTNTVLDDEAATAISAGAPPFTGSFRPESPLSAFDGKSPNGTWKLHVADLAGADTGTINSWGLTPSVPVCA
jgi:subtilisin-like proprotein convertase family protein